MKEEEKKCPISVPEWVNYLMQEQSVERFVYYNTVITTLTIFIILLTAFNIVISIGVPTGYKWIEWIGIFIFILSIIYVFYRILKAQFYMDYITHSETLLISDILNGNKKTDTKEKILKSYTARHINAKGKYFFELYLYYRGNHGKKWFIKCEENENTKS